MRSRSCSRGKLPHRLRRRDLRRVVGRAHRSGYAGFHRRLHPETRFRRSVGKPGVERIPAPASAPAGGASFGQSAGSVVDAAAEGQQPRRFGSGDLANFWLLHTVNCYLPVMKHFWTLRRVHPEELYRVMLSLAGGLSTFSLDEQARNLPDYDHHNLGACFTLLDEKIRVLLETAIPSKCVSVPLALTEKSIWSGVVSKEEYFKKSQFFLSVSAAMGVDDIVKQVPKQVKVSPPAEVQRLIRNALPGLTLRHAPVPPVLFRSSWASNTSA